MSDLEICCYSSYYSNIEYSISKFRKRHILNTNVLLFLKRVLIGPYGAFALPCLFPCGAPFLGPGLFCNSGHLSDPIWAYWTYRDWTLLDPTGPCWTFLHQEGSNSYLPQEGPPQGNRQGNIIALRVLFDTSY